MMNMMDQLNMLTSFDWSNAFAAMEAQAAAEAKTMGGRYYFYGEIDDPSEMLRYPNVTLDMVRYAGKTNWLRDMNGNFRTCNDALVDELADAGKLINGYYDDPKTEYDQLKTVEERVQYRMKHQGVDERFAKELVSEDEGFNAFKYRYFIHIDYTTKNQDGEVNVYPSDVEIDADTPEEALELSKNCEGWYVGLNIRDGRDYTVNPPRRTWEIIEDMKCTIMHTIECC